MQAIYGLLSQSKQNITVRGTTAVCGHISGFVVKACSVLSSLKGYRARDLLKVDHYDKNSLLHRSVRQYDGALFPSTELDPSNA